MKQVSLILEPGQIGSMKLKNRFVMAAMGHGFCDETDGYVSDRLIEFSASGLAAATRLSIWARYRSIHA